MTDAMQELYISSRMRKKLPLTPTLKAKLSFLHFGLFHNSPRMRPNHTYHLGIAHPFKNCQA